MMSIVASSFLARDAFKELHGLGLVRDTYLELICDKIFRQVEETPRKMENPVQIPQGYNFHHSIFFVSALGY